MQDGWYQDNQAPHMERYVRNGFWTEHLRLKPAAITAVVPTSKLVAVSVVVLGAAGSLLQMQTVSLFTGAGLLWFGAALALIGMLVALYLKPSVFVRVVSVLVFIYCIANVLYIESQLDEFRQQLNNFGN